MTTIDKCVQFYENLSYLSLPEEVILMSKKCLLDYFAAAIAGHHTQAGKCSIRVAKHLGADGICTIIGQQETGSTLAAGFVNGTLGSALDLDDGHRGAVGHPGVMVIPPVLAAAETVGNYSGKDLITAIVAGYELAVRCGIVMNSMHGNKFYGSGGWAVFGSAAGAAKMYGFSGKKLNNALTICEVYGPTAQCEKSIAAGSMTKESIGWGIVTALFSCILASEGFTGPLDILDDDPFYKAGSKAIFKNLGSDYEILNTYNKIYPSCKWSHSPIAGALMIKEKYKLKLWEIKSVKIETFIKALSLEKGEPLTEEAAQYSIPYTVASALAYGKVEPKDVLVENLSDPILVDLMKKISIHADLELEKHFPAKRCAKVSVELLDGTLYVEDVSFVKGDVEDPLLWEDIVEKFYLCAESLYTKEWCEEVIELTQRVQEDASVAKLLKLLRVPVTEQAWHI
jgi:2-methylcitrate dehydratase PrpD